MVPQDPTTKKIKTMIPQLGQNVSIRFGQKIDFTDLIEEHEKRHGPLWKYKGSVDEETDDDLRQWISKPSDWELYSRITRRIEDALQEMNHEALQRQ